MKEHDRIFQIFSILSIVILAFSLIQVMFSFNEDSIQDVVNTVLFGIVIFALGCGLSAKTELDNMKKTISKEGKPE